MDYKLFLPQGATENGKNVTLANGMTFPRYAFVAVPIVGSKNDKEQDILSEVETSPVYLNTVTNSFTLEKKIQNRNNKNYKNIEFPSLSISKDEEAEVAFNYDGYINISDMITKIKQQVANIKESETRLVFFEQDVGYTTVRTNQQVPYNIVSIDPNDDFEDAKYQLSKNLNLSNLLVNQFRPQTLLSQKGVSTKIIVRNLKGLAENVYEPVLENLIKDQRLVEIFSAYSETSFYAPDDEFYIGEAIQLRFPGATSATVYLYAKELASMLYYSNLYLEYYETQIPRITIMSPSTNNPSTAQFGTRFEHNLIHPGRLINIDKKFDDRDNSDPDILKDGSLNQRISFVPLNIERDKIPLENFIKEALTLGYIQSEEEAIKFAFAVGINISDVITTNHKFKDMKLPTPIDAKQEKEDEEFFRTTKTRVNRSKPEDLNKPDDPNSDFNKLIQAFLPSLIKCPPVANGSVTGLPDQKVFPMMSAAQFKPLTDPTMLYDPKKTTGQLNIPQHIRFNNPLLVGTVKGVTDKPEDGYLGEIAGKAVYANRLGGLVAGLRNMGTKVTPGQTLQSAVGTMVPPSSLLQVVASLTKSIFGVVDPTGSLLGCVQIPSSPTDTNMMTVMLANMMAAATQKATSPMTFEEIKLAQEHISGANTAITRTPGGNPVNEVRDPSKEQPNVITKTDQDAISTLTDIANTLINSVKTVIIDGKGKELETKSERKENQETTYVKYDSGTDHDDDLKYRGNPAATIEKDKKEEIMI